MPWVQFYRWQQWAEVYPFGSRRDDIRIGYAFAHLASIIVASQGVKGVEFKPSDFMVDFGDLPEDVGDVHPITEEEWREWKRSIKLAPIVKGNG